MVVPSDFDSLTPGPQSLTDVSFLSSYLAWATARRPASIRWLDSGTAEIDADLQPGESILVRSTYDRGWKLSGGTVRRDPIGFIVLNPNPGSRPVRLSFTKPWDVWLASAAACAVAVFLIARAPLWLPVAAACLPLLSLAAVAMRAENSNTRVAMEALREIRTPLIAPGGVVAASGPRAAGLGRGEPATVYGVNFGESGDSVKVWVGGQTAPLLYRAREQINFIVPETASNPSAIMVEVNGCRGNALSVAVH